MGCTPSKEPVCRNCRAPVQRSHSMQSHPPPKRDGDDETYHVVALTSSTLGSLRLDPLKSNGVRHDPAVVRIRPEPVRQNAPEKGTEEFAVGVIEAKTWSKMIEEKIPKVVPKTPIRTPPGEPETINAWELMAGLDDTSPLRPPSTVNHMRSFSFSVNPNSIQSPLDEPVSKSLDQTHHLEKKGSDSEPNSIFDSHDTSIESDFDPEVINAFRESLATSPSPPANPIHLKPLLLDDNVKPIQNVKNKKKLILYFTSLRGVRKTYEDCCHVRFILKGTGVRVDERDVSMHSGFKEELRELSGDGFDGKLPKVFVENKFLGGADEIRRLHEDGGLEKELEGCETVDDGGDRGGGGCEACGDIRFLPCKTCSGSCKIYYEGDSEEVDREDDESDDGFQRCPDCNENGLVRCPICWD